MNEDEGASESSILYVDDLEVGQPIGEVEVEQNRGVSPHEVRDNRHQEHADEPHAHPVRRAVGVVERFFA